MADLPQTSTHNKVINELFSLGEKKRYNVHIGETEQGSLKAFKEKSFKIKIDDATKFGFNRNIFNIIREIDVLWLKGNTIVSAFEVEDTTNVNSGIERFKALLDGAPNLNISTFIIVPDKREDEALGKIEKYVSKC